MVCGRLHLWCLHFGCILEKGNVNVDVGMSHRYDVCSMPFFLVLRWMNYRWGRHQLCISDGRKSCGAGWVWYWSIGGKKLCSLLVVDGMGRVVQFVEIAILFITQHTACYIYSGLRLPSYNFNPCSLSAASPIQSPGWKWCKGIDFLRGRLTAGQVLD